MKKIRYIVGIVLACLILFSGWQLLGPTVNAPEKKFLFIKTGSNFETVGKQLLNEKIINNLFFFNMLSKQVKYPAHIKPGKYEIKNGSNLISLVRTLKSGNQSPVRIVITKLRTKEDLAGKIGKQFEVDSTTLLAFLNNNDSLKQFDLDTNTVMSMIIPNSYLLWWNSSVTNIFKRLNDQKNKFWSGKRTTLADSLNLRPDQVYTIASIVEEETNFAPDKSLIASVYLNRLSMGMKLEADPTVKFAMKNFGLKRVLRGHLQYPSPFNTYRNVGLPPGPICTASISSIDAVLNAPKTSYLFFVAKPDFSGASNFATNYQEHLTFARAYQLALDSLMILKAKRVSN